MDSPSWPGFDHGTYRRLPTNASWANSRTWQSQYPSSFSGPPPDEPSSDVYPALSRAPEYPTSRTQPTEHPVRPRSDTSDGRTHGHGPALPVPIGTVPVAPGAFPGEQLGPPQPPPSRFHNDSYQSLPTRIPRRPAPSGYQPYSHRPEPHRPLHRTYSHSSDRTSDENDDEDTPPGRLPWMPWSSRQSMQRTGHGYASQLNLYPNFTHPSRPGSDTYSRGTNYDPDPSVVSFGGGSPYPRSPRYDDPYYRSSPTYNSRTNSIISRQPVPSPPQHNVTPRSSSQRQNVTQVPGVSSPPSDPRPASIPSSSQSSSQLGLTRLPFDHIRTTLATLPNEQQAEALPSEADPKLPNSGDTSRGMTSPGEQRDAGPSAASSGVPASESSKHTVTPSRSSPRRQKSAQAPSPSSPLDPLPASMPSHLNESHKQAGGILPDLPDSESGGMVPCDEQHDVALPHSAAPSRASGPRSPEQTVTPSESPFQCQKVTEAPCLSSPSMDLLPTSTPSRPNELQPPNRVLPAELSFSGDGSRGIMPDDEQRDAGPSAAQNKNKKRKGDPNRSKSQYARPPSDLNNMINRKDDQPAQRISEQFDLTVDAVKDSLSSLMNSAMLAKRIPYISTMAGHLLDVLTIQDGVNLHKGRWGATKDKVRKLAALVSNVGRTCVNGNLEEDDLPHNFPTIFQSLRVVIELGQIELTRLGGKRNWGFLTFFLDIYVQRKVEKYDCEIFNVLQAFHAMLAFDQRFSHCAERIQVEVTNVNMRYDEDQTPLHVASQLGQLEVMRSLIARGANPNSENAIKETPLFMASRNGNIEITQLLLENSADVNHPDLDRRTPLHEASEKGHDSVAQLLLRSQANCNAKNMYQWTPLHLASRPGKSAVVRVLLDWGAEVNVQNVSKWTPLHMASQKGHVNVVELLLARNARVDDKKADGETALHLAAYYGHVEVVVLLISHNADQRIRNNKRKTALDLAREKGHENVVQLIGAGIGGD